MNVPNTLTFRKKLFVNGTYTRGNNLRLLRTRFGFTHMAPIPCFRQIIVSI